MEETFYLTNIVPQDIDNNSGFWNRFEIYCRDLTNRFELVQVVTGPLYQANKGDGNKSYVQYEVDMIQLSIVGSDRILYHCSPAIISVETKYISIVPC